MAAIPFASIVDVIAPLLRLDELPNSVTDQASCLAGSVRPESNWARTRLGVVYVGDTADFSAAFRWLIRHDPKSAAQYGSRSVRKAG